tara:strand:- start:6192 stop:6710 length:519 start_codon:yes stop_codon:yes gene_type:complete
MKNLAGVETCDSDVVRELLEAKVNIVPHDRDHKYEVPASFHGELNGWKFYRGWYYWVVSPIKEKSGLPLSVAIDLHKAHGEDVRVAGHCGAPEPQGWVSRYTPEGRTVVVDPTGKELESFNHFTKLKFMDVNMDDYVFVKTPDEVEHNAVVPMYHVDTQVGLNALAETLRNI